MKTCAFPGCDNPASPKAAKGLCNSHYWQLHKGRTLTPLSYRRNVCLPWLEGHASYASEDCLIWPFQRLQRDGRGAVKINGKQTLAAPVMCEIAHGPKPGPEYECAHSCGNGSDGCVNPQHLRWATHVENEADKLRHGTKAEGERQGSHKLSAAQVIAIRGMAGQLSQYAIARKFGVTQTTIGKIIRRESWRHI